MLVTWGDIFYWRIQSNFYLHANIILIIGQSLEWVFLFCHPGAMPSNVAYFNTYCHDELMKLKFLCETGLSWQMGKEEVKGKASR